MTTERVGFEDWLGITPKGAAHDLAYEAFKAGAAWQRAQGAGVPDVSAMAKVLSDRAASACCVDPDDNWKIYGQEYIEDVRAMLSAAAHPAERQEQGEVQRLRDVLDEYERQTKALPCQHEIPERGCSTYNWCMSVIRDLRAMLAASTEQEVGK